ncbi:MAG: ATP synthase subunit I [Thermodesulfobacteriota bacterium]
MNDQIERDLVARLNYLSWAVMAALAGASLLYLPWEILSGVVAGGLLVTINVQLLRRAVTKALSTEFKVVNSRKPGQKLKRMLVKFYICFILTGVVIYFLISKHLVDVLGLLLGLSTFILTVFLVIIQEIGKLFYHKPTKEAF